MWCLLVVGLAAAGCLLLVECGGVMVNSVVHFTLIIDVVYKWLWLLLFV